MIAQTNNNHLHKNTPRHHIGCHDPSLSTVNRRTLASTECTNSTYYCWHQCMDLAEHRATLDICRAAGNLKTQCVDPRGLISDNMHGDLYPACTNATKLWEPYPVAAGTRNLQVCNSAALLSFANTRVYNAQINISGYCGSSRSSPGKPCLKGILQWNYDQINQLVDARVVANSLFGYIAFGLRNPLGNRNGMNGAHIIMALPGSPFSYTPYTVF